MAVVTRQVLCLITCVVLSGTVAHASEPIVVSTSRLEVAATGGPVEDIVCLRHSKRPAPRKTDADPLEMPSEEDLDELLHSTGRKVQAEPKLPILRPTGERMRVAVWGDSHMAAAFFTDELVRIAGLDAAVARPSILSANFGRPGVRLPVRTHCVTGGWRYENAYSTPAAATRPGPGLMSMVSSDAGSEVALDLRSLRGGEAGPIRVLYEGAGIPLRLGVTVDGGVESEVQLSTSIGPAALEIVANAPMSQLRLRILEGTLRLQGLALGTAPRALLQFDVFGYPGATVGGWARADIGYLGAWFRIDPYDLVVLAYGTNEGNAHPFEASAYRQTVTSAVANLRKAFPAASCLLIGPGDRGVLVRRSQKTRNVKGKQKAKTSTSKATASIPLAEDLLRYSRIHAEIALIQEDVSRAAGCSFWSPLDAMGGAGSAYRWRKSGLMAPDLIHFTVKGYQQLAQSFATAAGWTPATILPTPAR